MIVPYQKTYGKHVKKKILPEFYDMVKRRVKTFELRRDEDDIQPGDVLELYEWDGEKYTGHKLTREVTCVLRGYPEYGLMDGYCIIGIMPIGWDTPYTVPAGTQGEPARIEPKEG